MRRRIHYRGRMRLVEFLDEPDVTEVAPEVAPEASTEVTPEPETEKPKRKRRKKED